MKHAILWKRILNEGLKGWPNGQTDEPETSAEIITAPIIVASTPHGDMSWLDLRGIAMPFDKFWVEGETIDQTQWGCLFRSKATDEGFDITAACCMAGKSFPVGPEKLGDIGFQLDKAGTPIRDTFLCGVPDDARENGFDEESLRAGIAAPALAACLALMILGCKNVSLDARAFDPEQVRRAAKRFGGNADSYRYHVLIVRPPGSTRASRGPTQEVGVMPQHVCRGHFSEYGPEFNKGLLFGKYAGRFYVPPCLKGKKERGIVEKDYQIGGAA